MASLVREVKSTPMRRLVLEQAVLAALVDGHTSPMERAFLHELSGALELGGAALEQVEREVAGFYAAHREVVDVFTVSAAGSEWADAQLERVEHALEKNYLRLMQEVRETGELSVLLSRAARGQSLTAAGARADAGAAPRHRQDGARPWRSSPRREACCSCWA